jgi:hypothetical protein
MWTAGEEPNLKSFLGGLLELKPDDLLDVIELDRSERWRRGQRVSAEAYLREFPTVRNDAEASLVVIYGEYYLRMEMGESPSLTEYLARFPQHARRLRDQVMWHEAIELGQVIGGVPPPTIQVPGLTIGELLGRGGMCSVYLATDPQNGSEVAVKTRSRSSASSDARDSVAKSAGCVRIRTSSAPIAPMKPAACRTVMEYCVGGTLIDYRAAARSSQLMPPMSARVGCCRLCPSKA